MFFDRYHAVVLAAMRHRVGTTEAALDLTAETFAVALTRCATFEDRGPGSARAWLFGIARFKLIDYYRSGRSEDAARRRLGLPALDVTDEELDAIEQRLTAAQTDVGEALLALPADEREAVEARVINEDDYAVIAQRLSVSESVVRQRVSRGLRRLRARIGAVRP